MNSTRHTKSQSRVLRALELLDEVEGRGVKCLHGRKSIEDAIASVSTGRRSSQLQISDALAALVASGEIKLVVIEGMGGASRSWMLA